MGSALTDECSPAGTAGAGEAGLRGRWGGAPSPAQPRQQGQLQTLPRGLGQGAVPRLGELEESCKSRHEHKKRI